MSRLRNIYHSQESYSHIMGDMDNCPMPTMKQLSEAFGKNPNTIRRWSAEFADFLSEGANPEKGQDRIYDDDDAAVLALVAEMRKNRNNKPDDIKNALLDGRRGEWSPEGEGEQQEPSTALVTQLTAAVSHWEAIANTTADERDYLREQIEKERQRYETVLERAISAEKQLAIYESSTPEKSEKSQPTRADETPGDDIETATPAAPASDKPLSIGERLRVLFTGR